MMLKNSIIEQQSRSCVHLRRLPPPPPPPRTPPPGDTLLPSPAIWPSPLPTQIDAFTSEPFGGNPAAVVLLPRSMLPLPDAVRQSVAAEKNLSETAFLECAGQDGDDDFSACSHFKLRWFTPAIEVPLCGHATLASAAALLFGENNPAEQLTFETLSGELRVSRCHEVTGSNANSGDSTTSTGGSLSMDLPLVPASAADVPPGMEAGSALVQVRAGGLEVCCGPTCCCGFPSCMMGRVLMLTSCVCSPQSE